MAGLAVAVFCGHCWAVLAVGLWALCVSAVVEGWPARARSLFSRDGSGWKNRGGRSGEPIWVRGGRCWWRRRPAERRVRGWSVHSGWERGQSELGNGWPRKRACLWPAGSLWLGQREERKGLVFGCWKMAMRKRKSPGLVSKGGMRPAFVNREKKGAEGEKAGGLSGFCFSGFGRGMESGSSLALSSSLLAKGSGAAGLC